MCSVIHFGLQHENMRGVLCVRNIYTWDPRSGSIVYPAVSKLTALLRGEVHSSACDDFRQATELNPAHLKY